VLTRTSRGHRTVLHVRATRGSLLRAVRTEGSGQLTTERRHALYVRRTRTGLGRAVPYRVLWHPPQVMASANPADTFASVLLRLLRQEGPMALFNGWVPTYLRLGPHAILTFPLLEALRGAAGLAYI